MLGCIDVAMKTTKNYILSSKLPKMEIDKELWLKSDICGIRATKVMQSKCWVNVCSNSNKRY